MTARTVALVALLAACQDASRFTTTNDHYEGTVAPGNFVRAEVVEGTRMCVTLDASRLQDAPGSISTSDGRFKNTPIRPIPQVWHDSVSTLSFGEGRERNVLYGASPDPAIDPGGDVMIVLSLLSSGDVEVRILRGAPAAPGGAPKSHVFAVFPLQRTPGACSF
jgi:hypothetical protein